MSLILGANQLTAGGYEVDNSLRFNAGSDDSLTRTFGSSGNRKTWTFSTWIKRSNLINANMNILGTDYAGNGEAYLAFRPGEFMLYGQYEGGGTTNNHSFETTQVFRDVSAWYHILFVWDTTQSTSSNRMKLYINGTQVTSFSTANYPTQNLDGVWNSNRLHYIGDAFYGTNLSGYLSETYFIDGQALTPSSFGEFDQDTNIWIPIPYTGTFGTNGFYLEFQNSGALGTDSSSNGNTFTVNNLTSVDQSTDTPTNNFATLNPLNFTPSAITYTEGNLKTAYPASWNASISTIGVSAGKWYWEAKAVTAGNNIFYGIMTENATTNSSTPYTQIGVLCGKTTDGDKYLDTTYTASGFGTSANGDILGFALDLDSGTKNLSIYKNGTLITGGSVNLTSNFNSVNIFAFFAGNSSSAAAGWEANFGNAPYTISSGNADANGYGNFEYAVPSGYFALCTKNLAEYA